MSPRIASLLPGAMEPRLRARLGPSDLGGLALGRLAAEARGLPVVTAVLVANGSDADVDASVRDLAAAGADLYRIEVEALRRAAPDVVVAQDLCEVCAVGPGSAEMLRRGGPRGAARGRSRGLLAEAARDAIDLGEALERPDEGHAVARAFEERLTALRRRTRDLPRPRVAALDGSTRRSLPDTDSAACGPRRDGRCLAARESPRDAWGGRTWRRWRRTCSACCRAGIRPGACPALLGRGAPNPGPRRSPLADLPALFSTRACSRAVRPRLTRRRGPGGAAASRRGIPGAGSRGGGARRVSGGPPSGAAEPPAPREVPGGGPLRSTRRCAPASRSCGWRKSGARVRRAAVRVRRRRGSAAAVEGARSRSRHLRDP